MMIQVKDLSEEEIDKICRAIGNSFYDHKYGEREKGLRSMIDDREMMFKYMRAIFCMWCEKWNSLYHKSTGERDILCLPVLNGRN